MLKWIALTLYVAACFAFGFYYAYVIAFALLVAKS